ncbi:MAG TPA: serine hydrolase [Rhizomicrobium sp.]|jgi:CubicO group peptidase (beta-lactamase class C family)
MRKWIWAGLALCAATAAGAADTPSPKNNPGLGSILFWTPAQQAAGYKAIEKVYPVRTIAHDGHVFPLPQSADKPPAISYDFQGSHWDTDRFMRDERTSGLLIIKDGKIVLERYGPGRKPEDRWVSFSVTKSVTSTLVGAAIKDGYIKSLDAMVTDYIPGLKGSAYDGVTIRQILTMTSGVKWNEDYGNPKSDAAQFALTKPGPKGEDPVVLYMAKLPREAKPGTKFVYKTGESDMVGVLVQNATHKHLADYLSEKIWSKFGMESDANWMLDLGGSEIGGCCISATLRDYGRFGMFIMGGGVAGGKQVVPPDYLAAATKKQVTSDFGNEGYGYQWWIPNGGGAYEAIGIFGQSIYVNPAEKLVIVVNSAWPEADAEKYYAIHDAYVAAVIKALHK